MKIRAKKQPNILFVVIDALRAKNVGCYSYRRNITPNIDALANEGVLFENCYACANATDPSFTSMFSGEYPLSHGILHHGEGIHKREIERLRSREVRLLPELLKNHGYHTIGLDWLSRWHRKGYDYYLGIEKKSAPENAAFKKHVVRLLSFFPKPAQNIIRKGSRQLGIYHVFVEDLRYTEIAIDFIKRMKSKFFLMIHYWGCHAPYNPPRGYIPKAHHVQKGKTVEEMLQDIPNMKWRKVTKQRHIPPGVKYVHEIEMRYDGAISFADHLVGRLVEEMQNSGIWDNTLLILTADHGESITEHGIYLDHHGLYEETIRVPLLMTGENLPRGRRIKSFVQHTDLVPTILNYLGERKEAFPPFADGKSLMQLLQRKGDQLHENLYVTDASSEFRIAVRTPEHKFIYSPTANSAICRFCRIPHTEREELYDLSSNLQERKNILSENQQLSSKLRNILLEWIRRIILKGEKRRTSKTVRKLKESGRI